METVKPLVIALDGRSGAGKTSLANALARAIGPERVAILHVEDLYHGWDSLADTAVRLGALLGQLRVGSGVRWAAWDWAANRAGTAELVLAPRPVVLVEGVGSLHAAVRRHVDLGIWLDADDVLRKDRALTRDGEVFAAHWQRWADQEAGYLAGQDPRRAANLMLDADGGAPALDQFIAAARFLPQPVRRQLPAQWSLAPERAVTELPAPADPASLFEAISRDCTHAALLESTSHHLQDPLGRNRYTVLALARQSAGPRIEARSDGTVLHCGAATVRLDREFFDALAGIWPAGPALTEADGPPAPQWIGYLGYELKREVGAQDIEATLPDSSVRPDAQFFEPDTLLVIDHQTRRLAVHAPARLMDDTVALAAAHLERRRVPAPVAAPDFSCRDTREGYLDKVLAAKHQIWEGNTYEVCLTTELHARVSDFSPFEAYCLLRESSPAPFAHYLRLGSLEVASISPERFVSISPTGRLRAEPIKGTRPRGVDEESDLALRHDLATHPKDRAENIMIVDLLRNDLSHFAVPGSLSVPRLCAVESYATVHQMVSTIDAQLRDPGLAAAALRETFPPGSMTGAPKLSTMNILDELEEHRARGLYSGAVGYLGRDGSADLAVVIRTLVCDRLGDGSWQLGLGLGGAITADSDPQAEWDEVRTKSRGVLDALDAAFPHD